MKIQNAISDRAPLVDTGSPHSQHFFTGMMRCGQCDCAMHIASGTGRGKVYHYYICANAKKHQGCKGRRVNATEVDDYLIQVMLDEVLTRDRVRTIVREIQSEASKWWSDREKRRANIVAEIRMCEKKRSKLFEILELHGKDAPNLGDLTERMRELKQQIENWEINLIALEAEADPVLDISEKDIVDAADTLRGLVLNCEDPVTLRTFFSSFVKRVVLEADKVVIEYDSSKLMNHETSVVHSKNKWLPDLDSNQGPAD
ncbi:zinc ribbon domain-containing protein [Herminiimonas contaminans]|uniref:Zinc ribbon domain-containing protein n=2 Tax=Herminiimonas contaminans TaxID=1111140 RepID=A0ABS0ESX1_9BURK|nr:zinc ribbon domain-containing protein [Herminiimonas contaminans]